ncbi:MAG: hypothetical protein PVI40_03635 [Chlamydiota bacterium]|jgi:hypothetical protein
MDLLERADSLSKEVRYVLLLAPACIFLSYFLLPTANIALPLGGLFLCLLFERKGLYLSLALLLVDSVIQHTIHTNHLWLLGFEISIGLSFWIFSLAIEQIQETDEILKIDFSKKLESHALTASGLKNKIQNLEILHSDLKHTIEEKNKQINELDKEITSCRLLVETLQISKDTNFKINEKLSNDLVEAYRKVDAVKNLQAKLEKEKKEIKAAKVLEEQKAILEKELCQAKQELAQKNVQQTKQQEFSEKAKEQYRNTRQLQANYLQLKKQFKEKDALLHETRKMLYQTQTQLEMAQLKEKDNKFAVPYEENKFLHEIEVLSLELEELEAEVKSLEGIISTLSLSATSKKTPSVNKDTIMELPFQKG